MLRSKKILIKSSMDYDFNAQGTIHTEEVARSGFPMLVGRIKPPDLVMCWLAVSGSSGSVASHLVFQYYGTH
jgi:hypothetical protein